MANEFTWEIKDQLLESFKSAKFKQAFKSDTFKMCGPTWSLECYPNGNYDDAKENVAVYLKCNKLPQSMKKIKIKYSIKINELTLITTTSYEGFSEYSKNGSMGWKKTVTIQQLSEMESLRITCSIQSPTDQINALQSQINTLTTTEKKHNHDMEQLKKDNAALSKEMEALKEKMKQQETEQQHYVTLYQQKVVENDVMKDKFDEFKQSSHYTLIPVITMSDIEININNDIDKEIKFEEYVQTFVDQEKIIKKWHENTNKLQDFTSQIKTSNTIIIKPADHEDNSNDDNKQDDNLCIELYDAYIECCKFMDEQSKRLNQVGSKDHILQLLKNQNNLSEQIETNNAATTSNKQENDELNKEYEGTKQKRILLTQTIEEEIKECNEIIQSENDLLKQIKESNNLINLLNEQHKKLQSTSEKCKSLIDCYKLFEENNTEYLQQINNYYCKSWREFEAKWWKWSDKDIISWFKYKTTKRNTNMINWLNIGKELKKRNITGESLQHFNDATIDLIGIHDFNIAVYLIKQIQTIRNKYKMPINEDDEEDGTDHENDDAKDDEGKKIPPKYIGPLSKQIMMDPVIAFDENVYEREFIVKHLKEKGVSPLTKKKAHTLYVFSNNQLREEIKSYCELNNILNDEGGTTSTTTGNDVDDMIDMD